MQFLGTISICCCYAFTPNETLGFFVLFWGRLVIIRNDLIVFYHRLKPELIAHSSRLYNCRIHLSNFWELQKYKPRVQNMKR